MLENLKTVPLISVCIPTRNSSNRILGTLSIIESGLSFLPKDTAELIVIDNASDQDIKSLIYDYWSRLGDSISRRLVIENRLGVAFARARGYKECRGSVLVYCDDDVLPKTDTFQIIMELALTETKVGGGGGLILPKLVNNAVWPEWIDDRLKTNLALTIRNDGAFYNPHSSYMPVSALVWFRREALKSWFEMMEHVDFVFGPSGSQMWRGDDFEMDFHVLQSGWKLKMDQRLQAFHCIPPERLTRDYFVKLIYWNGRTAQRISNKWRRRSWIYEFLKLFYRVIVKKNPNIINALISYYKNGVDQAPYVENGLDDMQFNTKLHEIFQVGLAHEQIHRIMNPMSH
ncbi:MAG TPA: glycosyltransferase [Candidatus Competibacter sp.]|nr:glycosyltransferase [Candidatus Competibacter sp.]